MVKVPADLTARYGAHLKKIPSDVLEKLDMTELVDRLLFAEEMDRKANAATNRSMWDGYWARSRQVLEAQPRREVESAAQRLEASASKADDPRLARGYQERAHQLRKDNPAPPEDAYRSALVKTEVGRHRRIRRSRWEPETILYKNS